MSACITLIVAIARNGVIGRDNQLPWRIPEDLKRFKALTLGHPVIMGRKTWASLGRPLPGRENIVITRSRDYAPAGCRVVHTLNDAITAAGDVEEVFIIGGAEIYAMALPIAQRMQITEVAIDAAGDTCFPDYDRSVWRKTARETHPAHDSGSPAFDFVTYERSGT